MKTTEAQKRATQRYREKNRKLTRYQSHKSTAKTFLAQATLEDLVSHLEMAKEEIMKKELSILKHKEDGDIRVAYAGIDMEEYEYMTVEEFIEAVESSSMWDDLDAEVYEKALSDVGLDYSSYDDPDVMWEDFLKAVK